jgi:hypothetical protein
MHSVTCQVKPGNISFVPSNTQYVSKTLGQTSGESFPKYNKEKVHINICLQTHRFWGANPMILWSQSFRIVLVEKLNTPRIFNSNWKRRDTLPLFWCLSNLLQLPWYIWKGVTFHDYTCPCAYWCRWRTFWAPVVHCNMTNNNSSAFSKLEMCIGNVLYQL